MIKGARERERDLMQLYGLILVHVIDFGDKKKEDST